MLSLKYVFISVLSIEMFVSCGTFEATLWPSVIKFFEKVYDNIRVHFITHTFVGYCRKRSDEIMVRYPKVIK